MVAQQKSDKTGRRIRERVIPMILKKSKDFGDYSSDKGNDNALDDTSRGLRYFLVFIGSFLGALFGTFLAGLLI